MTIKETTKFMERIKQHYQEFVIDEYRIEEWYKYLKDYDYDDVNKKLDEHLNSENYGDRIPKISFLVKYLIKAKDKNKIASQNIIVCCQLCNKKISLSNYNNHYYRCLSEKYLMKKYHELNDKNLDVNKLQSLNDESFNNLYKRVLKEILQNSNNQKEIEAIHNYLDINNFKS